MFLEAFLAIATFTIAAERFAVAAQATLARGARVACAGLAFVPIGTFSLATLTALAGFLKLHKFAVLTA